MKVLIAVHHYPPRYKGGGEEEARRYARGLIGRGHEVRVVCVERIDDGPADDLSWEDGIYEGVPVRRLSFDLRRAPDRFLWEYDNPWVGKHLSALFESWRPDLFHLVGGYLLSGSALRAARQAGVPATVRVTDFWYLCPRINMLRSDGELSQLPYDAATCARCLGEERRRYRLPGQIAPFLMKAFWRLRGRAQERVTRRRTFLLDGLASAAALFSPSQFVRNVYVAAGVDPRRIHFMRQGVEVPAVAARALGPGPLRLGFVGQIARLKGVDVLVRAVRALPGAPLHLTIYGDLSVAPDYVAELRRLAEGDVRIELRGVYQDWGGLSRVLADLDVLVVPSVWYENSPTVILEANAHGVPVVASDLGGMAELVRHEESGLLFPVGDAPALALQIERLVSEPALLSVLASGVPPVKTAAEEIEEYERRAGRLLALHAPAAEAHA